MSDNFDVGTHYNGESCVKVETPDGVRWHISPEQADELADELKEAAEDYL